MLKIFLCHQKFWNFLPNFRILPVVTRAFMLHSSFIALFINSDLILGWKTFRLLVSYVLIAQRPNDFFLYLRCPRDYFDRFFLDNLYRRQ